MIQLLQPPRSFAAIEEGFGRLASKLEPPVLRAHVAHEKLRARLSNDEVFGKHCVDTFLGGSYRRRTAIRPLKDVDIFVVLNGGGRDVAPALALRRLKAVLDRHYPRRVFRQRRSLRVEYGQFTLDVVPLLAPNGLDRSLLVPDREVGRWLPTNPKGHIEWVADVNSATGGRPAGSFVPLVKVMKAWKRHHFPHARHPKGFALECWLGQIDPVGATWATRVISALQGLSRRRRSGLWMRPSAPLIIDPGVRSNRLVAFPDRSDYSAFLDVSRASLRKAESAMRARSPAAASTLWREVFGPAFPLVR